MPLTITNTFIAHTPILSSAMNQNFQDIQTWANNLGKDWTSFSPTWNGSVNNGVINGFYCTIGDLVFVNIAMVIGSTTTIAGTQWQFGLPTNADTQSVLGNWGGICRMVDAGTQEYLGTCHIDNSGTYVFPYAFVSSGTYATPGNVASSVPFSWTNGDSIYLWFSYRKA